MKTISTFFRMRHLSSARWRGMVCPGTEGRDYTASLWEPVDLGPPPEQSINFETLRKALGRTEELPKSEVGFWILGSRVLLRGKLASGLAKLAKERPTPY